MESKDEDLQSRLEADLQEKLLSMGNTGEAADLDDVLNEYREKTPLVQKLEENRKKLMAVREGFPDDKVLFEKFLGFKPLGPFRIILTPFSFRIDIYNPIDWARMGTRHEIISHNLIKAGEAGLRSIDMNGEEVAVPVETNKAFGLSHSAVVTHEMRHSLNGVLNPDFFSNSRFHIDVSEDFEVKRKSVVDYATALILGNLKDELSAYLSDGSSRLKLGYWTFRPKFLAGLYDFRMSRHFKDYLEECKFTREQIDEMDKEVSKGVNVRKTLEEAYTAAGILEQKGYSRIWAVSYLCTAQNLARNWIEVANQVPARS